ncbi:NADH-dependent [FeFe] hydrogenase, group A6 [Serpentinicella alkaliphila]|uniref:NAD(P)-dependent iron-only hydrogenase catalytic subunit n=1 Tax=Serpentinicella alkaliphila TaxID=1734049 RepID=A0A4R2THN6_9FIRM|nr:NADH-dependent [FeFe] hydrogenase, group A6 [Serpentinicella alkaliphila]QUH24642.1 iron hydrogenase small subunit [Serpentinicella alkaliphila]TCQ03100.1 NAD(P)-dependent iron-only hydrogenase catalytic subunit [Serpentinicella alkaliphila]
MSKVKIKINETEVKVPREYTVLDAAKEAGVMIPTLCHLDLHDLKFVNRTASCRVCMVEVEGQPNLAPACATPIRDGMVIKTDTLKAITARRMAVEFLLSNHPTDCLICPKNLHCELQELAQRLSVREIKYTGTAMTTHLDTSSQSLVRNQNKCILCRRCETACNEIQTCGILSALNRGFETIVGPAFNLPMVHTSCTYCGQCVAVCPTAALTEVNHVPKVWEALNDPEKFVVVQTAPAIRVAIGELFNMPAGSIVTGKLVAALRKLGFDRVFDTDFGADLTVMEEAKELIHRIEHGGRLPMLTSCCPAWVSFIEHQFPDLVDVPSTCKSPHIMFGTIANTFLAKKLNIEPSKVTVVSIMPCIAKKAEAARTELSIDDVNNVDIVITTRELAAMIKEAGIDFDKLQDEDFDHPLGETSGASVIFGTTGGVIEATMRTAYEWLTGEELKKVEFKQLRGLEGIREAAIPINGEEIRIGIAHGLGNARQLLEEIRSGKSKYHAIEIMACPGGCIGGGGQPFHHGNEDVIKKRQEALYKEDKNKKVRQSHKNKEILELYENYLGQPYGKLAHELLHTRYRPKERI